MDYISSMICINCNKKGHGARNCGNPITSFGIIAIRKNTRDTDDYILDSKIKEAIGDSDKMYIPPQIKKMEDIKLLMIQRKDTIGFTDFMRGKYKDNSRILEVYFSEMCKNEQERLQYETFDQVWDKLWINHKCKTFKNERESAKKKFQNTDIQTLIEMYPAKYEYQEFGFPKGRKNGKETDIECAHREFCEETSYTRNDYVLLDNLPIIEEFIGTDNVKYKHVYYIALATEDCPKPYIDKTNKTQLGEVGNIGWLSYKECLSVIRPYDIAKKSIVKSVYEMIYKGELDLTRTIPEPSQTTQLIQTM